MAAEHDKDQNEALNEVNAQGKNVIDEAQRSEVDASQTPPKMTLMQTAQSVLWAMLGVQSKRNARRDFSQGKLSHFVVIGLVFTLLFILTLVSVIQLVIPD